MPEVLFTGPGYKDLGSLPAELQERVKAKLRAVRAAPGRHLKRLRGYDLFVLRVGDHRVILDWDAPKDTIYVHAIGHRRSIYDRGF